MARKSVIPSVLVGSLADADKVLQELAELQRRENSIANTLNEKVDAAKAEAADKMGEVNTRRKILEAALSGYAITNKSELFKTKKSLDLDFGTLSFRASTSVVTAGSTVKWAMVLDKIKEKAFADGIRTKEEIDKEALMKWSDEKLAQVGAKKKTVDTFGYELKQQEPGQTPAV